MSSTQSNQPNRTVYWVHQPLSSWAKLAETMKFDKGKEGEAQKKIKASKRPTGLFALYHHHAILVEILDSTGKATQRYKRYALKAPGWPTDLKPELDPPEESEPAVDTLDEWRRVGYTNIDIGLGEKIHGVTNLTDEQILHEARELIKVHGDYNPLVNSCQDFAVKFFLVICNVQGSKRAYTMDKGWAMSRKVFGGEKWPGTALKSLGAVAAVVMAGAVIEHVTK